MLKVAYAGLLSLVMLTVMAVSLSSHPASGSQAQISTSSNIEMVDYLGGRITAAYSAGNYAYLAQGNALAVVNVSNPAAPIVVGVTPPLTGQANAIYAASGYAYALVANQLYVIDVNNPAQPAVVNSLNVGYATNVMQGAQNRIYILGEYHWAHPYYSALHLTVVDISNPALPQIIGSNYDLGGQIANANGIFVAGTTIYLAMGNLSLHIVDASNPQQIVELGSYGAYAQSVFVSGTVAYLGTGSSGLLLLNIGTPASPTLMASTTVTAEHVVVAGSIAYVTGYDSQLHLINVSQPSAPIEIGAYDAGAAISDLSVVNDRAYLVLGTGELLALNISGAPTVTTLGRYRPWPLSVSKLEVSGSMAYVIDSGALAVMDIHDPLTPTRVGAYDQLHDVSLVKISDQVAYVVDSGKVLHLLDVSSPITPVALGVYTSSTPTSISSLAVESQTVYLAEWKNGLSILDVSNPVTPTQVSTYSLDARDVAVANGLAYVLAGNGLHIIDVRQPLTPTLVVSYPIATDDLWTWVGNVRVSDNKAFVTTHQRYWCGWTLWSCTGSTLTILDVSDPTEPAPIGSYVSPYPGIGDFLVKGNLIYLSNGFLGLKVLNASNPQYITEAGSFQTGGAAQTATTADQVIYVVDSSGGLYTLGQMPVSLTGRVANHYLSPMAGVTVEIADGLTTTTDANGRYIFAGLTWGTRLLTPTLAGYVFVPPTRTVTLPPSAEAQDFMVLPAPVSTTLIPGAVGQSLAYTDTQGLLTRLDFAPKAVPTTLTLVLTPTLVAQIPGWAFAGHAFDLAAYQADVPQPAFTFSESVTVTIQYSPNDVSLVSDQTQLELRHWAAGSWSAAEQSCSAPARQPLAIAQLAGTFSGTLCTTGRFALFGPTHEVYAPIIWRNTN